jgi:hypothetical protein
MMHHEKAERGRYCHFCGQDNRTLAVIGRRVREKLCICADCAGAALRLLSSKAAGEQANRLHVVSGLRPQNRDQFP